MREPTAYADSGSYQIDVQTDEEFSSHVDSGVIIEAVAAALRQHGVEVASVAVLITDDATIRAFSRQYRGIDAATDVLSFPQQSDINSDSALSDLPDDLAKELRRHLGDLVIAFPYMQRQASRYQSTVLSELRLLAVHGTLHLLGYDHATEEERATMWSMQGKILASLGERTDLDRDYD